MYSTALPLLFPEMLDEQSAFLRADGSLLSLYEAFAAVPDPRSRHGQRYDLPSLLTCLVAALLCNCNSLEAVGQWCRDHQLLLRRLFGPRDFYTPTGSLYRRLLPRLSGGHIELALAAWVNATRPPVTKKPWLWTAKRYAERPKPRTRRLRGFPSVPIPVRKRCSRYAFRRKPTRSPSPKRSCRASLGALASTRLMRGRLTPTSWRWFIRALGPVC